MADTSERMLRLLTLLQSYRDWSGPDLAERLEVSPRTLRRDIDRLRTLGYPVEASPGVDGGYRLAPGASMPPLVLDDDEAVGLVVALRAAANLGVAGAAEASVTTLAKVVQVIPPRLRQRADDLATMTVAVHWADPDASVDTQYLTTLASAARNTQRVEFGYRDKQGARTSRRVEPMQLVTVGRRWYLVAFDNDRADWRTFRVDRIDEPRATGARFPPKPIPHGDAATYVRESIKDSTPHTDFVVDVDAPAAVIRERTGRWVDIEQLDQDRCRVTIASRALEWPTMLVTSLGADFEVRSPPEFATHLATVAGHLTNAASARPDDGGGSSTAST
ncbi:helix-turn-helix transcriptional regulator [Ilumatobacter nonamiensis]|uniref:helix-turn-helix transcriptional regulator n=1 Tax=Ilumatobacter nonamiensis TaxID=467093 RepID=UPI000344CB00|nr:YafY family protein [Ilumatobacter nonamiensis]